MKPDNRDGASERNFPSERHVLARLVLMIRLRDRQIFNWTRGTPRVMPPDRVLARVCVRASRAPRNFIRNFDVSRAVARSGHATKTR